LKILKITTLFAKGTPYNYPLLVCVSTISICHEAVGLSLSKAVLARILKFNSTTRSGLTILVMLIF
jgi:hypothetical protein